MKKIVTTNNYEAIVDDKDYDMLSNYSWQFAQVGLARSVIRIENKIKCISMRKSILECEPGYEVICKDNNYLNHTRKNLIKITKSQLNRMHPPRHGKFKGVFFDKARDGYSTACSIDGKGCYLMTSNNATHLAKIYDAAIRHIKEDFAYLNFPSEFLELPKNLKWKIDNRLLNRRLK